MKSKKVYFIRHAQSKSNEAQKALKSLIALDFRYFQQKISCLFNILPYDLNSDLTSVGEDQCKQLSKILHDSSTIWSEIDMVIHSPMKRTRQTCSILTSTTKSQKLSYTIIENVLMEEANIIENLNNKILDERIQRFERWLITLDDDVNTILLIGHGTFFQRMLQLKKPMNNCDVLYSELTVSHNNETTHGSVWSTPNLIHTIHDDDNNNGYINKQAINNNNNNDIEKICRICHASNIERPDLNLICPCLCKGSLSYVHLSCLNTWRATSNEALYKCSVCKYEYNIKRSKIALFLLSKNGPLYLTILFIIMIVIHVSILMNSICQQYLKEDLVKYIYNYLDISPIWREPCHHHHFNHKQMNSFSFNYLSSSSYHFSSPKRFLTYFTSNHFQHSLFCQFPWVGICIETFFLGITIVGSLGTISFLIEDIRTMIINRHHNWNHIIHNNSFRRLFGISIWLSTSNRNQMTRIFLLLGCLLGVTEVYKKVSIICRKVSQAIGEQVLETRNSND